MYTDVPPGQWEDWTWQVKNSLKSLNDFDNFFNLTKNEKAVFLKSQGAFKFQTTPYYANLVDLNDPNDPLRKIQVPLSAELEEGAQSMFDPLGENDHRPARRIIHRYPDRVLFLVTDFCSVYCRYCTRKHFTAKDQVFPKKNEYEESIDYIARTKSIREVILSGGDPLTLSDNKLEKVLNDISKISHVELIRLGTRIPVVNPMRITKDLVMMMQKYHPVFIMTHFNHPKELTPHSENALKKLVNHGFPVLNQLVLLNGVNNHPAVLYSLNRKLLKCRVKPYYMFQCDPSQGTDHLRTTLTDSLKIQKELFGRSSGLAHSTLSMDIPSGGGKAYFVPNQMQESSPGKYYMQGWDTKKGIYIDPQVKQELPSDYGEYLAEWDQINF